MWSPSGWFSRHLFPHQPHRRERDRGLSASATHPQRDRHRERRKEQPRAPKRDARRQREEPAHDDVLPSEARDGADARVAVTNASAESSKGPRWASVGTCAANFTTSHAPSTRRSDARASAPIAAAGTDVNSSVVFGAPRISNRSETYSRTMAAVATTSATTSLGPAGAFARREARAASALSCGGTTGCDSTTGISSARTVV